MYSVSLTKDTTIINSKVCASSGISNNCKVYKVGGDLISELNPSLYFIGKISKVNSVINLHIKRLTRTLMTYKGTLNAPFVS